MLNPFTRRPTLLDPAEIDLRLAPDLSVDDDISRPLIKARGSTSTMQNRTPNETEHVLPNFGLWSGLDLFPTPPWGTRALFEYVLPRLGIDTPLSAADPAAGLGHMSEPLSEYIPSVYATDIFDYRPFGSKLDALHSFTQAEPYPFEVDWIITNPPFGDSSRFLFNSFKVARKGVMFLVRLNWLESDNRYKDIWLRTVPNCFAWFTGRLPMCIGGYDPNMTTATAYAWFIWVKDDAGNFGLPPSMMSPSMPIPFEAEKKLFRPEIDIPLARRFVTGFIPPSLIKKKRKKAARMLEAEAEEA
jgi:hypothetical protein